MQGHLRADYRDRCVPLDELGEKGRTGLGVDLGEDDVRFCLEHRIDFGGIGCLALPQQLVDDNAAAELLESLQQRRHGRLVVGSK